MIHTMRFKYYTYIDIEVAAADDLTTSDIRGLARSYLASEDTDTINETLMDNMEENALVHLEVRQSPRTPPPPEPEERFASTRWVSTDDEEDYEEPHPTIAAIDQEQIPEQQRRRSNDDV